MVNYIWDQTNMMVERSIVKTCKSYLDLKMAKQSFMEIYLVYFLLLLKTYHIGPTQAYVIHAGLYTWRSSSLLVSLIVWKLVPALVSMNILKPVLPPCLRKFSWTLNCNFFYCIAFRKSVCKYIFFKYSIRPTLGLLVCVGYTAKNGQ